MGTLRDVKSDILKGYLSGGTGGFGLQSRRPSDQARRGGGRVPRIEMSPACARCVPWSRAGAGSSSPRFAAIGDASSREPRRTMTKRADARRGSGSRRPVTAVVDRGGCASEAMLLHRFLPALYHTWNRGQGRGRRLQRGHAASVSERRPAAALDAGGGCGTYHRRGPVTGPSPTPGALLLPGAPPKPPERTSATVHAASFPLPRALHPTTTLLIWSFQSLVVLRSPCSW